MGVFDKDVDGFFDEGFDFDHDGKLDAMEEMFEADALAGGKLGTGMVGLGFLGDDDWDDYDDSDDDDDDWGSDDAAVDDANDEDETVVPLDDNMERSTMF